MKISVKLAVLVAAAARTLNRWPHLGQATVPPCSPPCTITAIVYLGLSKGAQQINQEIVSCLPLYFA